MCITKLAIEKNRITMAIVSFFLILGIFAFYQLPRSKDPHFVIRAAVITTTFKGATPERIEALITSPLERKIKQLSEVEYVTSSSSKGISTIYVYVKDKYDDLEPIWDRLRKKLKRATLPKDVQGPFVNDEYSEVFGTIVTLTGEGFSYAELKKVAEEVRDDFYLIDEVGKVDLLGLQKEKIYIEFSNAKLAELGLSPDKLGEILQQRNIISPGGVLSVGNLRLALEPTGNIQSIQELKKIMVPLPGKDQAVRLEDIVDIKLGYSDPKDPLIRFNSSDSIAFAISLSAQGNIINLGDKLSDHMRYLQEHYPIGIEFDMAFNEPNMVDIIISEFLDSLLISIFLVIFIMFITLGWRIGLIVAVLIPTTILTSLFIMWNLNIGLNQVSLAALIISLGLLVDSAIVMTESIMVQMEEGNDVVKSALYAAKELKVSLLTSSLTTSAAFLPIYMADSVASEYTSSLFEVVTITLLSSWVLSLTLTPLLCYFFLKTKEKPSFSYNNPFCNTFKKALCYSLRKRHLSMALTTAVFIFALSIFTFVPKSFFPPTQQPSFLVKVSLPKGSSQERTLEAINKLEAFIKPYHKKELSNYISFVGQGAPRFWINYSPLPQADEYGEILINAKDLEASSVLQKAIENYALDNFLDAQVSITLLDNGPPVENAVAVRLSGENLDILNKKAEALKVELSKIAGVKNINDDWGSWTPKLIVNINPTLAYHAGVTYNDIAKSLQTALTGKEVTQFRVGDKTTPIVLRSSSNINTDLNSLKSTLIFVRGSGKSVPLTQVAKIDILWKPPKIIRRNGIHTIQVSAEVSDGITAFDVADTLRTWLDDMTSDIGFRYEFGGAVESSKEAQGAITDKLPIALMIILIILIGQFNSYRRAALILITIPLGLIGVIVGLLITNSYFGFMTFLGVISLIGIVINNAIILIERIEIEIHENKLSPQNAIIEAAQRRLRPIILTSATTIGGLIPLWLTGGPMWEPMAIAIIFGLGFSTLLTLGVVPILYSLFFNVVYSDTYRFVDEQGCSLNLNTNKV